MIMARPPGPATRVIFITWDESDFTNSGPSGFGDTSGCCDAVPGGGHVVTLTISHSDHSARTSDVAYNHYSMLATIEGGWKLGCLDFTCDTANVPADDRSGRPQEVGHRRTRGRSPHWPLVAVAERRDAFSLDPRASRGPGVAGDSKGSVIGDGRGGFAVAKP